MCKEDVQNGFGVVPSVPGGLSPANAGRKEGRVQNVCKIEIRCAQPVSKVSEWAVQNGFGVVPSVPDGGSEPLSQSESATPENIPHPGVSRNRGIQNVV